MLFLKIYFGSVIVMILIIWLIMLIRGKNIFKLKNYYEDIAEDESVRFIELKQIKNK